MTRQAVEKVRHHERKFKAQVKAESRQVDSHSTLTSTSACFRSLRLCWTAFLSSLRAIEVLPC